MTRYTFFWKARDGSENQLSFISSDGFDAARDKAMTGGYPGHCGGWWNWLVDDVHEWLVRRGWTNCKCHPSQPGE